MEVHKPPLDKSNLVPRVSHLTAPLVPGNEIGRKVLTSSNLAYTMLSVQTHIAKNTALLVLYRLYKDCMVRLYGLSDCIHLSESFLLFSLFLPVSAKYVTAWVVNSIKTIEEINFLATTHIVLKAGMNNQSKVQV